MLERLKDLYTKLELPDPVIAVTDIEKDWIAACQLVFLATNYLLYLWHINKNVLANYKKASAQKKPEIVSMLSGSWWLMLLLNLSIEDYEMLLMRSIVLFMEIVFSIYLTLILNVTLISLSNASQIGCFILIQQSLLEEKRPCNLEVSSSRFNQRSQDSCA